LARTDSERLFAEALTRFPGGVNSPVRAFRPVGGTPPVIVRGNGATVWDADGTAYTDLICAWGAMLLGHARPAVVEAVQRAAADGLHFGANSERELELARIIQSALPSVERLRLVNSGTEAAMSAVRLARAFTGRSLVVKFDGGYHGHADGLLARAGSGLAAAGLPDSVGVTAGAVTDTAVLPYNDADAVTSFFQQRGNDIAAVLVEPVAANMGVVPPGPAFLPALRRLTTAAGALLIFDEVITGFRVGWKGAQGRYGVTPDLTCLGKIIGGGLPVGAYGGRRDLMECVAPLGPMYQAGTMAGNPVVMAAGTATLQAIDGTVDYDRLEGLGAELEAGLLEVASERSRPVQINRVGSLLTVFFTDSSVTDRESAERSDRAQFRAFFHGMLERGILLPPSNLEAWFLSLAHTESDIERVIGAARSALAMAPQAAHVH